jgi:hypothetical protein
MLSLVWEVLPSWQRELCYKRSQNCSYDGRKMMRTDETFSNIPRLTSIVVASTGASTNGSKRNLKCGMLIRHVLTHVHHRLSRRSQMTPWQGMSNLFEARVIRSLPNNSFYHGVARELLCCPAGSVLCLSNIRFSSRGFF